MGRCIQEYLILYLKSKYIHIYIYITDCISANGSDSIPKKSPVYVIKASGCKP